MPTRAWRRLGRSLAWSPRQAGLAGAFFFGVDRLQVELLIELHEVGAGHHNSPRFTRRLPGDRFA